MDIKRSGSQPAAKGLGDWFTGTVTSNKWGERLI